MNYFQRRIFSSFRKGLQKEIRYLCYRVCSRMVFCNYLLSKILDVMQSKIYLRSYYYGNEKSPINNRLNVRKAVLIVLGKGPQTISRGRILQRSNVSCMLNRDNFVTGKFKRNV